MEKFIRDSVRYPEQEREQGLEALVSVNIEIRKDGKVVNPSASFIFGSSDGFLTEAKRLALSMPKWIPATKNGRPNTDRNNFWISFTLPDSLVHLPPPSDDTTTYDADDLDTVPVFPGDDYALQRYLQNTIRYPQMEKETGVMGTVYISYVIGKNGMVTDIKPHKEVQGGPGLTKESIRVISGFPRHKPAMKNGKAVRCKFIVPVRYNLQ